mmetsp:Transcript_24088/g.42544  ORF Transcript_24088/g.42544 Transcript_24088/m.42544 type:complete len:617 (+) Transcript_24088:337-2187(+)|eukprot:CAMPEP_0184553352 /NCGR_PEP_ID=MMETSP0199_2-20130426/31786_1 /TAXON_ID=1112570 /ORGANISM="Thraustochytrium sp., Strain LLF1b" /LENGTH=616 /DNA_ID=CAMNT_0026949081 /DNA_START=298 /DNA_END=2148 /DNA_ORIENTATION=+
MEDKPIGDDSGIVVTGASLETKIDLTQINEAIQTTDKLPSKEGARSVTLSPSKCYFANEELRQGMMGSSKRYVGTSRSSTEGRQRTREQQRDCERSHDKNRNRDNIRKRGRIRDRAAYHNRRRRDSSDRNYPNERRDQKDNENDSNNHTARDSSVIQVEGLPPNVEKSRVLELLKYCRAELHWVTDVILPTEKVSKLLVVFKSQQYAAIFHAFYAGRSIEFEDHSVSFFLMRSDALQDSNKGLKTVRVTNMSEHTTKACVISEFQRIAPVATAEVFSNGTCAFVEFAEFAGACNAKAYARVQGGSVVTSFGKRWEVTSPQHTAEDSLEGPNVPDASKLIRQDTERPMWPKPFAESGMAFALQPGTSLYYDKTSNFYYDPTIDIYFSCDRNQYFRYSREEGFLACVLPSRPQSSDVPAASSSSSSSSSSQPHHQTGEGGIRGAEVELKLKRKRRKPNVHPAGQTNTVDANKTTSTDPDTRFMDVQGRDQQKGAETVCLLCRRRFPNHAKLSRHIRESRMHADNLENQQATRLYLDRSALRRNAFPEADGLSGAGQHIEHANNDLSSAGATILKSMGWKVGAPLGRSGEGVVEPVDAIAIGGRTTVSDRQGLGHSSTK